MIISPQWQTPNNVMSLSTTRLFSSQTPGYSLAPFHHFNLGTHVNDDPEAVASNRLLLTEAMSSLNDNKALKPIAWLNQVHGCEVVERNKDNASKIMTADGQVTAEQNLPLAVLTADCLPVLLTDKKGRQVAAVHCGWRPLAQNILIKTVNAMDTPKDNLLAWFGPCISQTCFEVGAEVYQAFVDLASEYLQCFVSSHNPNKFFADLRHIAQVQLQLANVSDLTQSQDCTFSQSSLYYSYRREQNTGRMATLIWLR